MTKNILESIQTVLKKQDLDKSISLAEAHNLFEKFLKMLETGEVRAASPDDNGRWTVNTEVKQLILYGFKLGKPVESIEHDFQFCDKHNLWPSMQNLSSRQIRIVPGGTAVRRGACIKNGVTVMPPAYINIGAFVDEGTMIDSHVTVGSCAQVGRHCHISAATQLGGVLEPIGAIPTIIEDDVFVGGNSGIYEGTHVHTRAVIASGTIITRGTPLFDLVNQTVIRPIDGVLHVPENAVVVPGSRAIHSDFARENGLSAYAPLIVKYRDNKTDASIELESWLR